MPNKYGELSTYTINDAQVQAIKISIPNPPKTAFVRLPASPEIVDFFKENKKLTQEEKSLVLFNKIRLDKEGIEFDEYEATSVIDSITRSRGLGFEREGNCYKVEVETPFCITAHTVSIPTQKQLAVFRRNAVKNYLNAVVALYGELVQSIDGYIETITVKDVPMYHMLDCINQSLAALDALDPIVSIPGIIDPNVLDLK